MLPDARTNMSRARRQYADNGLGSVSSQENSDTGHTEGVTRVSQLCRSASLSWTENWVVRPSTSHKTPAVYCSGRRDHLVADKQQSAER